MSIHLNGEFYWKVPLQNSCRTEPANILTFSILSDIKPCCSGMREVTQLNAVRAATGNTCSINWEVK